MQKRRERGIPEIRLTPGAYEPEDVASDLLDTIDHRAKTGADPGAKSGCWARDPARRNGSV
jgi:hypothetical protein